MAPAYIAGDRVEDAMRVCARLQARGWGVTVCPWDDETDPHHEMARRYAEALVALRRAGGDGYLSVKAPSFGYDRALLADLVAIAEEDGRRIHFDSMYPQSAQPTLDLVRAAAGIYPHLGCTLPARWPRSLQDVAAVAGAVETVRVVKGQWADPVHPDTGVEDRYEAIVRALAGRVPRVAVASHDPPLVARCLDILAASDSACELELLYGLPRGVARLAAERGVPVRMYVPYGVAYLPYALNDLRRRPRILAWIARDMAVRALGLRR
ncbi:MAG: proline dehydrogenase [Hyphomicrobiales bacterium]|nr:proline dehydrogenase [Hyphomicrobiales bacterium]